MLPPGRTLLALPAACPDFFIFFREKVMKKIKKSGQAAWRWQGLAVLYYQRVILPVQFWRACGSPVAFRPRLPWWHHWVLVWLRFTRQR
jgi:hypothetical protein